MKDPAWLESRWAALSRPLVLVILAVNVIVTLVFRAGVEAQSGAYATAADDMQSRPL